MEDFSIEENKEEQQASGSDKQVDFSKFTIVQWTKHFKALSGEELKDIKNNMGLWLGSLLYFYTKNKKGMLKRTFFKKNVKRCLEILDIAENALKNAAWGKSSNFALAEMFIKFTPKNIGDMRLVLVEEFLKIRKDTYVKSIASKKKSDDNNSDSVDEKEATLSSEEQDQEEENVEVESNSGSEEVFETNKSEDSNNIKALETYSIFKKVKINGQLLPVKVFSGNSNEQDQAKKEWFTNQLSKKYPITNEIKKVLPSKRLFSSGPGG